MSLLSSWPRSGGNFHSAFWDMRKMQRFHSSLAAQRSKEQKSSLRCGLCPPALVASTECVLLVTLHRLCLFPPWSQSWPVPGAPAVLPATWSVGRFDILNSYYIQTPFTELVFAEEWIILFDNTVFTSGKMWHSRHQISVSVFCLAIKVPDYNPWEFNTPLQQFPVMPLEWA